jgi:hypothetical protein
MERHNASTRHIPQGDASFLMFRNLLERPMQAGAQHNAHRLPDSFLRLSTSSLMVATCSKTSACPVPKRLILKIGDDD